jgi:hypothetical protein
MNNWLTLSKEEQVELFTQIGARTNLPPQAVEKDAWVWGLNYNPFKSQY